MLGPWAEWSDVRTWALLIEAAGAILIGAYTTAGFAVLFYTRDQHRVRDLVAEGSLNALAFLLCATLLKTLILRSWKEIGMFAGVFLLRTVLKRVFQAEVRTWRSGAAAPPS